MAIVETTALKRTFRMGGARSVVLPGLGPDADVTHFEPICFVVEGKPKTDDFYLAPFSWELLGQPDRIVVTVEAAE